MEEIEIRVPADWLSIPTNLFELTWAIIGFLAARSFSKRLDEDIMKELETLKSGHPRLYRLRWLFERTLHFIHHYWIGLLMMTYSNRTNPAFWIGYGFFIEDGGYHLKEFYRSLKR